jgi:hypothetical protein
MKLSRQRGHGRSNRRPTSTFGGEQLEDEPEVEPVARRWSTMAPEWRFSASAVEVVTPEPAECRSRKSSLAEGRGEAHSNHTTGAQAASAASGALTPG